MLCMDIYNQHAHRIELGMRISRLRVEQGFSTRKFSIMVGMSRSQLRRIEIGESSPTVDMLERIAEGLDVKAYRLINFDEEFRG